MGVLNKASQLMARFCLEPFHASLVAMELWLTCGRCIFSAAAVGFLLADIKFSLDQNLSPCASVCFSSGERSGIVPDRYGQDVAASQSARLSRYTRGAISHLPVSLFVKKCCRVMSRVVCTRR